MHAYVHTYIPTHKYSDKQTYTYGWMDRYGKSSQAKPFSQQLYFIYLVFLYLLRQKVLYKITLDVKCYIKWKLQKDVDTKFRAMFYYNVLIKSSWSWLVIVHTCDFILGPKCFHLNAKLSQVYFSFNVIRKAHYISFYATTTY